MDKEGRIKIFKWKINVLDFFVLMIAIPFITAPFIMWHTKSQKKEIIKLKNELVQDSPLRKHLEGYYITLIKE